jgi:spore germination cell wall hydrolase CwlJ-like protein
MHSVIDVSSSIVPIESITKLEAKQLKCLIKNAFHEAGNQGDVGILLVTEVVYNRAKLKNKTFCEIIYAKKQFSWTQFKEHKIKEKQYERIKLLILDYHYGFQQIPPLYKEIIAYHADYVDPYWNKHYKKVGQWKNHIFYKALK